MKRWLFATVAAGALLLGVTLISRSSPHTEKKGPASTEVKRTIRTSGTATVKVSPDAARLVCGVHAVAKTVNEAHAEVKARASKILTVVKELKLSGFQIESSLLRVEPVESEAKDAPSEEKKLQRAGFRVSQTFTFCLHNGDVETLSTQMSRVLDTVLQQGGNSVDPVEFFREDTTPIRRKALARAAEDARANAEALARGARVGFGEVVEITDEMAVEPDAAGLVAPRGAAKTADDAQEADSSSRAPARLIGVRQIEITCRVKVVCTY